MSHLSLRLAALLAAAPFALGQVPTDHLLVVEAMAGPFGPAQCVLVDQFGGGSQPVPLFLNPIWLFAAPTGVAIDPTNAQNLFLGGQEGFGLGIDRVTMGLLGQLSTNTTLSGGQVGGTRIRVGTSRVFTLRSGGIVEGTPKNGGSPFVLLQRPDAVDIAIAGSLLYVACRDAANPQNLAPLIEINLQTAAQRIVGQYPDVVRIAASRVSPVVALGTESGIVGEVSASNGSLLSAFAAGGPVQGLGYSRQGALLWGVGTATGYDLFSAFAQTPIRSSSWLLRDFDVGFVPAASVVPFGSGCGAGAAVSWGATSTPTLGNSAFEVSITQAPPNAPAALFFGASRLFSTAFGSLLPLDLTPLANGCSLLVDPVVPFLLVGSAAGDATQNLPIPSTPSLAGVEWSGQVFVIDPSVGPLSLAATSGIALRLDS